MASTTCPRQRQVCTLIVNNLIKNECYEKGTALIKGDGYCSDHQWGIAFDVYVNGENGEDTYTDPKYLDDWDRVGEIGKELGLNDYELKIMEGKESKRNEEIMNSFTECYQEDPYFYEDELNT